MRNAWQFYDPFLDETYILPVNPSEETDSPDSIAKDLAYSSYGGIHRASDGTDQNSAIIFTSNRETVEASYNGRVYDDEQKKALEYWVDKDSPIEVTDDLGKSYTVLFNGLSFSRLRTMNYSLKLDYVLKFTVLNRIS